MAIYRAPRMLIDPGHKKGYNRGAYPGYCEGNQVWRLSLYLQAALRERGIVADLTKGSCEEDPSLSARGRMAAGYDAFTSMHSDACADPTVDRVSGICMVPAPGSVDEQSRELAEALAPVVAQVMGTRHGYEVWCRKSEHDRDGDGYRDDYYTVLLRAKEVGTAGIILEHGFHSCPEVARWLMDNNNLRRLAEAEAQAIEAYFRKRGFRWAESTTDPIEKKEESDMFNPVKPGDKGESVKRIQRLLKVLGRYDGEIDGSYGPATKEAVKKFQKSVGLTDDGVAGAMTVEALSKVQLFVDVPTDAWYAKEVTEAVALGLAEGVGGGKIEPERAMTRAEAFALAVRLAKM